MRLQHLFIEVDLEGKKHTNYVPIFSLHIPFHLMSLNLLNNPEETEVQTGLRDSPKVISLVSGRARTSTYIQSTHMDNNRYVYS